MQYLELDFYKLEYFFNNSKKSISYVQYTIFISAGSPFHTLSTVHVIFQVNINILYFYDYKVNRSTKSVIFTHFKKSLKKKGLPKKVFVSCASHN